MNDNYWSKQAINERLFKLDNPHVGDSYLESEELMSNCIKQVKDNLAKMKSLSKEDSDKWEQYLQSISVPDELVAEQLGWQLVALKSDNDNYTPKITSFQQLNELVAEQLGWQLVALKSDNDNYTRNVIKWFPQEIKENEIEQWLHNKCEEGYSYYYFVPNFASDPYWNKDLLDYLLTNEQCEVQYNLKPDRTEVSVNYVYNSGREFYRIEMKGAGQLGLCLAFLNYKGIKFTLDKNIYNDYNS
jgi:hypothetical protein